MKVMLTCFFNSRGIMHHEYAPEGQTINKEYYLEILRRFRDAVLKKRPHMWTEKNWKLHHDNAPAHSVHVIKGFLAKNNTALVRQPPSTSALAPHDFLIFPKLKTTLKRRDFSHVRTLWKKRRRSSGAFQGRSSRDAFKSGRGAGKSVCTCKGSILKEIK